MSGRDNDINDLDLFRLLLSYYDRGILRGEVEWFQAIPGTKVSVIKKQD